MRRAASVTSPTGFVKFTNVASGARRATTSAIDVTIGTVRRANVMPPAPVVSWPMTPWARAAVSSRMRPAMPPARTAQ